MERSGLGERSGPVTDVAQQLVGVQAQVMSSAEIALSLRCSGVAPTTVEQRLTTATRTAAAESNPGRQIFFIAPRANNEPEPTLWWSCSS